MCKESSTPTLYRAGVEIGDRRYRGQDHGAVEKRAADDFNMGGAHVCARRERMSNGALVRGDFHGR
jgi:hypothetical protein